MTLSRTVILAGIADVPEPASLIVLAVSLAAPTSTRRHIVTATV